jgi:hypothetical protein
MWILRHCLLSADEQGKDGGKSENLKETGLRHGSSGWMCGKLTDYSPSFERRKVWYKADAVSIIDMRKNLKIWSKRIQLHCYSRNLVVMRGAKKMFGHVYRGKKSV